MRRFSVSPTVARAAKSTLNVPSVTAYAATAVCWSSVPWRSDPAMEPVNKEVNYFMSIDTADAVLRTGDKELPCPLIKATEGSDAFDISKLLKETGHVTLHPGFINTASCRSAITYIDGDAGILRYRGYPIEQLAENSTCLLYTSPSPRDS